MSELQSKAQDLISNPNFRKSAIATVILAACIGYAFWDTPSVDDTATAPVTQKSKKSMSFFNTSGADRIENSQVTDVMTVMKKQMQDREKQIDEREASMQAIENRLMGELEAIKVKQVSLKQEMQTRDREQQRKALISSKEAEAANKSNKSNFGAVEQPTLVDSGNQGLRNSFPTAPVQQKNYDVGNRTIDEVSDSWLDATGHLTTTYSQPAEATATADTESDGNNENKKEESDKEILFLPAGSIISGVMITGMDIPTGNSSSRDPFPAIFRIKEDALLPNNFTADVKECVIVSSAKASLSTTRAYFRAEAISCVLDNGKAVEANLTAYSVGDDGKAGIKGKLVSRNAEVALQSAYTGFLSGLSSLFGTTEVNVGDDETGVYSAFSDGQAMKNLAGSAALKGAGAALDNLSEYYIQLTEEMKPYLEVNGGLSVSFVVQRGSKINLN